MLWFCHFWVHVFFSPLEFHESEASRFWQELGKQRLKEHFHFWGNKVRWNALFFEEFKIRQIKSIKSKSGQHYHLLILSLLAFKNTVNYSQLYSMNRDDSIQYNPRPINIFQNLEKKIIDKKKIHFQKREMKRGFDYTKANRPFNSSYIFAVVTFVFLLPATDDSWSFFAGLLSLSLPGTRLEKDTLENYIQPCFRKDGYFLFNLSSI